MRGRGTGSLRQKPNGGWFVKPPGGAWIAVSTVLGIPAAQQKKSDAQKALEHLMRRGPRAGADYQATISDVLAAYRDEARLRGLRSMANTIPVHHRKLERLWGDLKVAHLTRPMLVTWATSEIDRGAKPGYVRNSLNQLRAALRFACDQERIDRVVAFPTIKVQNTRQAVLEPEEFAAIHPYLLSGLREASELAYVIGWRKSEVFGVTWPMVDRTALELRIPTSKNGEPRVIGITREIAAILERCWLDQVPGCPWVFQHKGRRLKRSWSEYHWRKACQEAGVVDRRFHDFRRVSVTRLIHKGVPERVAMDISGHKTMSMLYRYAIKSTKSMREALEHVATPPSVQASRAERPGPDDLEQLWRRS